MKIIYNNVVDSNRYIAEVVGDRVRIGRNPSNDIVLNSPYVPEEAMVLYRRRDGWELISSGMESLVVGDRELHGGERLLITSDQQIKLFPFVLTLDLPGQHRHSVEMKRRLLDEEVMQWIQRIHVQLLKRIDIRANDSSEVSEKYLLGLERNLEEVAQMLGFRAGRNSKIVGHIAGHCIRSALLSKVLQQTDRKRSEVWESEGNWSRIVTSVPNLEEELEHVVEQVAELLNLDQIRDIGDRIEAIDHGFWGCWEDSLAEELFDEFRRYLALRYLKKQIKDMIFGYGPLEDLLRTPTISEIMVVDRNHIYIEKSGVLEVSGRRFVSDEITQTIIERIVSRVNRTIDKSQPLVDARLTDGSRVNAIVPPLAVSGPCLTIRKFPEQRLLIDDLVRNNALTRTVAEFLRAAVIDRRNILISGGTGTGKTTLLNCLSDFIPDKERIVTIEDTAELQIKREHVVRLETKQANVEGTGEYTIRDLVRNALRMRPDRVVVGECRGAEALDMLQAMNTGHDGSLTTIHANSATDVILRLEVLVQMAAALPITSIRRQIAAAIDLVVQLTRLRDGRRVVSQITEFVEYDSDIQQIRTRDIFALQECNSRHELRPTGQLPSFMPRLIDLNLIDLDSFYL